MTVTTQTELILLDIWLLMATSMQNRERSLDLLVFAEALRPVNAASAACEEGSVHSTSTVHGMPRVLQELKRTATLVVDQAYTSMGLQRRLVRVP